MCTGSVRACHEMLKERAFRNMLWACCTAAQAGRTPLHAAAGYGHFKVVQELVRSGAQMELRTIEVRCTDSRGTAVSQSDAPAVPHAPLLQDDETPLHWAARYGNLPEAKFLLSRGAHLTAKNAVS